MAIILEGVDHSPVMWGKIGKHVVQGTKLGKMFIKIKVTPTNPRTQIQQEQRSALAEGVLRWKNFEKLLNKSYWDLIAVNHRFRDGYRAFLSSFLVTYRMKLTELGNHTLAQIYSIPLHILPLNRFVKLPSIISSANKNIFYDK